MQRSPEERQLARPRRRVWLVRFAVALVLAIGSLGTLGFFGIIHLNNPSPAEYPVRGVDVSAYQGQIDWPVLSEQGIDFAYLKATEGSTFVDSRFAQNWQGATSTALRVGAYHFFSFESPGVRQAEHFIAIVPTSSPTGSATLPPMVDLELYDAFVNAPPARQAVVGELSDLLRVLEDHYGQAPVIYATAETYSSYLAGDFPNNDIWIRDTFKKPTLSDGRAWTFWQFTDREHLDGYQGSEWFIDVNVFAGTKAEFASYGT